MTRGRKKDLSIPPSRALTQQRDYRARKAQYLTELEERCKRAEEENARLKQELEWARAGLPLPSSPAHPETAKASADLMHHLTATTVSLARFQRLAFESNPSTSQFPTGSTSLRPASFPSPAPSPPNSIPPPEARTIRLPPIESFIGGAPPSPSKLPPSLAPLQNMSPHSNRTPSPSLSLSSDSHCCGGLVDCSEFCEERADTEHEIARAPTFERNVMGSPLRLQ